MAAIEKLTKELESAKDKQFAKPIIEYLIKRCEEDTSMAEDVSQEHKSWEKCYRYIYSQARKVAGGKNQCAIYHETVFEWAEDYYRLDDAELEKQKAKKVETNNVANKPNKSFEDSAVKKAKEQATKVAEKLDDKDKTQDSKSDKGKQKKDSTIQGQMSLFDFM